jgi:hypothetical protein
MSMEGRKRQNKRKGSASVSRWLAIFMSFFLIVSVWFFLFDIEIKPSAEFYSLLAGNSNQAQSEAVGADVNLTEAENFASLVVPEDGYTVNIKWGDTGKKLVAAGGIDLTKYKENYKGDKNKELLTYLTDYKDEGITINRENAYFWVNTLWALGLTQKSDVLEKGVMGTQYRDRLGNFASTGGWTLGARDAVSLFSSSEIVKLTAEQNKLVEKITSGIFRPCCGNSAAFPDCNHGMAILGLVELMVAQGMSEEEIFKASLAFNSYWFAQTYMDLAYYFETRENTTWDKVDPKRVLSAEFSSSTGYQALKRQLGDTPSLQGTGGGCGA